MPKGKNLKKTIKKPNIPLFESEPEPPIKSPWIHQLVTKRSIFRLPHDIKISITIIGGGIAGVVTAYFILKYTNFKLVLVEGNRIAHGATGHNAGQMVSYFERSFASIVEEYGLDMAIQGQKDVFSAWDLVDEIVEDMEMKAPFFKFAGYAGCTTPFQIKYYLENLYYECKGGLNIETILISDEYKQKLKLDSKYEDLYAYATHEEILGLLQTKNPKYIAALASQKGCMNSALFTEELVQKLATKYSDRFKVYEYTPINQIILEKDKVIAQAEKYSIESKKVILCTNGFENIEIINKAGRNIDKNFHELVNGVIGYMAAYLEPCGDEKASAVSYFGPNKMTDSDTYTYVTRREYEYEENVYHNLICVSGPEIDLPDKSIYDKGKEFPRKIERNIRTFVKNNFSREDYNEIEFAFKWHGLMGYTLNGLRCIGPEPLNPRLIYNLGCNGVGILPSIFAGKKISGIVKGRVYKKSIFDPKANYSSTYRLAQKLKKVWKYLREM